MNKQIINLYEHFKNTSKKLKIICDWDEVIQAHEPYVLWKASTSYPLVPAVEDILKSILEKESEFKHFFSSFWKEKSEGGSIQLKYSPFGSNLEIKSSFSDENNPFKERYLEIKNSPNFYQEAPFLTIAEDLLKLIKEDKVKKLWFLSTYDKRKFPDGDDRKREIFNLTFEPACFKKWKEKHEFADYRLVMVGFDSETQGQTKADWIKENVADFDIVIDDNPNICRSIVESNIVSFEPENQLQWLALKEKSEGKEVRIVRKQMNVIAPYYPAVAEQHHEDVLLVKTSVSDLKKEDFK